MRLVCIEQKTTQVYGVLTNYKQWIFTRFSMSNEIANKCNE